MAADNFVQIDLSRRTTRNVNFRVALVYPPFAPLGVASLGLGILAAGVRERGLDCKVFYWNADLVRRIPYADRKVRYQNICFPQFFPANEWVFKRVLYPKDGGTSAEDVENLLRASFPATQAEQFAQYWDLLLALESASEQIVAEMVARLEPYDLIGISTTFYQNVPALALARVIKAKWPSKIIVLGGANCHGEMGITLAQQFDFLDYVFLGEADFDFPELVSCVADGSPVAHVREVAERVAGTVEVHTRRPPIEDLDTTPVPVFDDYVSDMIDSGLAVRPNLLLPLETSRGCWWGEKHHCTFCGLNAEGMKHRRKSPGRFRHEAQAISERYAVSYFFMADNILQANLGNGLLAWNREPNQQLSFFFEIRPTASRKQVAELVEHGVTMVQPGIEHFSTKTLLLMEKNLRGISNIAFLKYAREYGLRPIYNLLCRFPGEDESEYLRLALDLPKLTHLRPPSGVSPIQFHRFSPYHSSAERFGLKLRPYAGYEMLYPFKEGTLARIAYIFVRADSDDDPADLPSYVAETSRLISDWREYYVEGICTLTWIHAAGGVHIEDRRRAFTPADYHLEDAACHLFYALDEPRSLPAIVRQFQTGELPQRPCPSDGSTIYEEPLSTVAPQRQETIGFSAADFVRDPRGHLQPMLDAGLLIEEDDRLLALPVHKRRRRLDPQWNWFDV